MFVSSYLSFRLLGSALPLLSLDQLKDVLSGEVMMLYGEHVVTAQVSEHDKLSETKQAFLQVCLYSTHTASSTT